MSILSIASYTLANHLVLLRENVEKSVDNIVHAKNSGHRRANMPFHTYLHHQKAGEPCAYTMPGALWYSPTEGPLEWTGNAYNVALKGQGFFALDGGAYTRAGLMVVNANRELVTPSGQHFLDNSGEPIILPDEEAGELVISRKGEILDMKGAPIAILGVFQFEDERFLKKRAGSFYPAAGQEALPASDFQVLQMHLEGSNVSTIAEMAELSEDSVQYKGTTFALKQNFDTRKELIHKMLTVKS